MDRFWPRGQYAGQDSHRVVVGNCGALYAVSCDVVCVEQCEDVLIEEEAVEYSWLGGEERVAVPVGLEYQLAVWFQDPSEFCHRQHHVVNMIDHVDRVDDIDGIRLKGEELGSSVDRSAVERRVEFVHVLDHEVIDEHVVTGKSVEEVARSATDVDDDRLVCDLRMRHVGEALHVISPVRLGVVVDSEPQLTAVFRREITGPQVENLARGEVVFGQLFECYRIAKNRPDWRGDLKHVPNRSMNGFGLLACPDVQDPVGRRIADVTSAQSIATVKESI